MNLKMKSSQNADLKGRNPENTVQPRPRITLDKYSLGCPAPCIARASRSCGSRSQILPALVRFVQATLCVFFIACLPLPGQANGSTGTVEHVVVVWLTTPGDQAAQEKIITASQVLKSIPGVVSLKAGTMIPSDRSIVDSSFDVMLSVTLTDIQAMQHYLTHPIHVQLVEATLKPLVDKIRVYDYRY